MVATWTCPRCKRSFTRRNQRHACGTGDRAHVLRGRHPELVRLYGLIETFARTLGDVELVTRERYVLLRRVRIFADLVMMTDAVRIAIHLGRQVEHPIFFKVVSDGRSVSHVAKVRTKDDLGVILPLLEEAYAHSLRRRAFPVLKRRREQP